MGRDETAPDFDHLQNLLRRGETAALTGLIAARTARGESPEHIAALVGYAIAPLLEFAILMNFSG